MIVLPLPDPGNHRFIPSRNDIYNIMYRASIQMRHSKIDQEKLAHKIAEWLQESPQDKLFLRPSTKSASDIFKSAQEGGGRKRGMNTANLLRNTYKRRTEQHKKTANRIAEITQKFLHTANCLVL